MFTYVCDLFVTKQVCLLLINFAQEMIVIEGAIGDIREAMQTHYTTIKKVNQYVSSVYPPQTILDVINYNAYSRELVESFEHLVTTHETSQATVDTSNQRLTAIAGTLSTIMQQASDAPIAQGTTYGLERFAGDVIGWQSDITYIDNRLHDLKDLVGDLSARGSEQLEYFFNSVIGDPDMDSIEQQADAYFNAAAEDYVAIEEQLEYLDNALESLQERGDLIRSTTANTLVNSARYR